MFSVAPKSVTSKKRMNFALARRIRNVTLALILLALFPNLDQSTPLLQLNAWAQTPSATPAAASAKTARFPKGDGTYLQCSDLKRRVRDFLRVHYAFDSFNEELSGRTFDSFFRFLDPGKAYFLQSDIDGFAEFRKSLPKEIASGRCDVIYRAFNLLIDRMDDSLVTIKKVLAKPFDYTLDESIEIDRSKLAWAKNQAEIQDRWYKSLKFMNMGLEDTDPSAAKNTERIIKRYERDRKNLSDRSTDELHALFLNAFASSLDPHSSYMKPVDQDEFRISFALELVGIGASLTQRDGYTIVDSVIPGGAAARDGRLKKDDKIIAVDPGTGEGVIDVVDMELDKVVQHIRGKKDSVVKLTILRKEAAGEPSRLQLQLVRDVVKLADGEAKSDIMTVDGKKIGVILLPAFYLDYQGSQQKSGDFRSSAKDVEREINALRKKKVDGIVLDLRSNGGGDLGECGRITGLFIDQGPVVQIQDRDRRVSSIADPSAGAAYQGPLLLLINKQSASASEIIAGALQDYGRAIIAGNSRTYGKGSVQHVIDVPGRNGRPSDGAIKVTISKFFRPSGKSNQEIGVASDVVIPNVLDVFDFSESKLDYVLKTSEIRPHREFKPLIDWKPYIEDLRKKSKERVAKNDAFKKVFESVAEATKEQERTTLSLKREKKSNEKDKSKKSKESPSPKPGEDDETAQRGERKVIRDTDIELKEAGHILVDSIAALGPKQLSWDEPASK